MSFAAWYYPFFLMLVTVIFWLLPRSSRILLILAASFTFYGFWDVRFCSLLIAAAASDYLCTSVMAGRPASRGAALWIGLLPAAWAMGISLFKHVEPYYVLAVVLSCLAFLLAYWRGLRLEHARRRQYALTLAILVNAGILLFFKYANWFSSGFENVLASVGLPADWVVLDVLLPVGVSFHTFQSIAYAVDVYGGHTPAERNFWRVLCMIMFFPQLVSGPIERASRLLPQLKFESAFDWRLVAWGLHLLLVGYFLKIFVADNCAVIAKYYFGEVHHANALGPSWAYAGVAAFAAQIYADFAGYSYIARGSAMMLGVQLSRNFELPYLSRSPGEFWSRWHISLSSWFRDYVFTPLSLSRSLHKMLTWPFARKTNRALFISVALIATMLLAGAWHGSGWNFVVFGAFHGVLQALWRIIPGAQALSSSPRMLSRISSGLLTFTLVCVGWILFRCDTLADAPHIVSALSGATVGNAAVPRTVVRWLILHIVPLALLVFLVRRDKEEADVVLRSKLLLLTVYFFMFFLLLSSDAGRTQFIYFQF